MAQHDNNCPCCECTLHNSCPTVQNPNWTTIMPMKVNEVLFGPVDILPDKCLYEIKELFSSQFISQACSIHHCFLCLLLREACLTGHLISFSL